MTVGHRPELMLLLLLGTFPSLARAGKRGKHPLILFFQESLAVWALFQQRIPAGSV